MTTYVNAAIRFNGYMLMLATLGPSQISNDISAMQAYNYFRSRAWYHDIIHAKFPLPHRIYDISHVRLCKIPRTVRGKMSQQNSRHVTFVRAASYVCSMPRQVARGLEVPSIKMTIYVANRKHCSPEENRYDVGSFPLIMALAFSLQLGRGVCVTA